MNELQKKQIAAELRLYCERHGSQNKAARTLKGVSSATISQALNGNWELIKAEMWRSIAAQIGVSGDEWVSVDTTTFQDLSNFLGDAQVYSNVFAITAPAGTGKSYALKQYGMANPNAYLLSCNEYWNRKTFMQELLTAMGRDFSGYTVNEMMGEVVANLKKQNSPLIMLDEADKLSDQVMYFFITLYNQLEDHCGIVLCATDHLAKRIKRGIKLNKKGYNEIYSRIGRKFIELVSLGVADIAAICKANGIEDGKVIKEIVSDCEGDLRRVKRKIHGRKRNG